MRCLALAQAWQDSGGQAVFVTATEVLAIERRLQAEGFEVVRLAVEPGSSDDAVQTVELARQRDARWLVVDGYRFGAEYQQAAKRAGLKLLFIDDNGHAQCYCADLVLNQNVHAHDGLYVRRERQTRILLGTRYALLRREFRRWSQGARTIPPVARNVLVTLGGADPENVTLKVIQALQRIEVADLEATVVAGASNVHHELLQAAVRSSPFPVRLERNVNNMPERMAGADLALTAGGSTCWELAYMGLPACTLILADNQEQNVRRLGRLGQVLDLGLAAELTEERLVNEIGGLMGDTLRRQRMSELGRALVDGRGALRVVEAMTQGP
jgi:UDP-2,4-diacetamido-2,4,6-trideoxy-beta-L-altropyranose hydrolase